MDITSSSQPFRAMSLDYLSPGSSDDRFSSSNLCTRSGYRKRHPVFLLLLFCAVAQIPSQVSSFPARLIHPLDRASEPQQTAPQSYTDSSGAVYVNNWQIAALVLCLSVVLIISHQYDLRVEKDLMIAAVRCFVQLSTLGFVLVPIIANNFPPVVLAYIMVIVVIAAFEASSRPPYTYASLFWVCVLSIGVSLFTFGSFTLVVVIGTNLDARYAIPIMGMMAGSSMSTISIAVSATVTNIAERKSNIEALLSLGASRWEASKDIFRSSIVLGLTPIINQMTVTGLVSIPGMMTGQIIGGTSPGLAARYQLVIMFVISGTAALSTLTATGLTLYKLIDNEHQIRSDLLISRERVDGSQRIISAVRDAVSSFLQWRQRITQQNSPFPSHAQQPPCVQDENSNGDARAHSGSSDYGAIPLSTTKVTNK